jgi:hypothetical protein
MYPKPKIKEYAGITIHKDSTVSFWSVYRQCWERKPAVSIDSSDLMTMPECDRLRIEARFGHRICEGEPRFQEGDRAR